MASRITSGSEAVRRAWQTMDWTALLTSRRWPVEYRWLGMGVTCPSVFSMCRADVASEDRVERQAAAALRRKISRLKL
jgi:hypothetical protein